MEDVKLNYDDITVVPEQITTISSRKESNPYDEQGFLPIYASCMSSVVSIENVAAFNAAKIHTVIPRSYSVEERLNFMAEDSANGYNFVAFSLNEVEDVFLKSNYVFLSESPFRICIDLANGHMERLLDVVKKVKDKWGEKAIIMTGNIANPQTYKNYEYAGVDYVRVGIGGGSVCSTSSNVAIHYPYFSLLKEIYEIKKSINGQCKIVADGNIKGFRDIQKALIYADYVMIGGLFNKAMESAGRTTYGSSYFNIRGKKIYRPLKTLFTYGKEVPKDRYSEAYKLVKENKLTIWKENFGMSTKIAQALIASANTQTVKSLKTSEGLFKYQKVEYDLKGWAENETDFLRSAMSYTNSKTLDDYKDCQWVRITQIRYNN